MQNAKWSMIHTEELFPNSFVTYKRGFSPKPGSAGVEVLPGGPRSSELQFAPCGAGQQPCCWNEAHLSLNPYPPASNHQTAVTLNKWCNHFEFPFLLLENIVKIQWENRCNKLLTQKLSLPEWLPVHPPNSLLFSPNLKKVQLFQLICLWNTVFLFVPHSTGEV